MAEGIKALTVGSLLVILSHVALGFSMFKPHVRIADDTIATL